jgi:LysM repeat protein
MESATTNPSQSSQPDRPSLPTINISPSQRLEQLPIGALLAFVPRLRTTYRVVNRHARGQVATSRTHYRLKLGTGHIMAVSDNLVDLLRLIDGRRSIQALSDALAEQQSRPVHPAEIVHLLRYRLAPGGLVELSFPLALPEPQSMKALGLPAPGAISAQEGTSADGNQAPEVSEALASNGRQTIARPPVADRDVQWIPPGRRAERLRATRRPAQLPQRLKRASYINLIATLLIILAAGTTFAFARTDFAHTSFTLPNLSTFFGGPTPTPLLFTPTPTPTPIPQPTMYIVSSHFDTLANIAAHFGVTVTALMLVNHLSSPTAIQLGQPLIIPTIYHRGANPAMLAYPIFYVVQLGDNLYTVAQFFDTTPDVLARFNHLKNPAIIQPGQALVIPSRGG